MNTVVRKIWNFSLMYIQNKWFKDCPVYQEDIDQLTALHIACERGKLDCVKLLVKYGAAVNTLSMVEDWTPLSCAQINGHQQVFII